MRHLPTIRYAAGSLGLVAIATIAAQISVMRALSVDTYHHFTYLVISTALLGFGASGTALTLLNRRRPDWWRRGVPICLAAFALSLAYVYRLSVMVRPDLQYLLYQLSEFGKLWLTTLLLFVPFFCAGLFTGTVLYLFRHRAGALYGVNMAASGTGAALAVGLTSLLSGTRSLEVLALAAVAALAVWVAGGPRRTGVGGIGAVVLVALIAGGALFLPEAGKVDQYKALAHANRLRDQGNAEQVDQRFDSTIRLDLVDAPSMHHTLFAAPLAPPPPDQNALFLDGNHAGSVLEITEPSEAPVLGHIPQVWPYRVFRPGRILLLGDYSAMNVWLALREGATRVVLVQPYRPVSALHENRQGPPFDRPEVELVTLDPRTYLERTEERFDLIQIAEAEGMPASSGGLASLGEDYLLTMQAVGAAVDALREGGVLSATRGLQSPPRDNIRLFTLFAETLRSQFDLNPEDHLAQGHNYLAVTTVLARRAIDEVVTAELYRAAADLSMDVDYAPGITPERLTSRAAIAGPVDAPGSHLYHAARAVLSDRAERFYDQWVYDVRPPTDNRPYFHNFFKPESLRWLFDTYGDQWFHRVELGIVVVVLTLAQVTVAGLVLILLPLVWLRNGSRPAAVAPEGQVDPAPGRLWVVVHFGAIGTGFMLLEMLFIQQLTRFLGAPAYATAVVLAGMLIFSGIGSAVQEQIDVAPVRRIRYGASLLVLVAGGTQIILNTVLAEAVSASMGIRVVLSLVILAPTALLLGIHMPAGLARLSAAQGRLVPLAWAVNGVTSVVAAPLAVLVAVTAGFGVVAGIALVCYLMALIATFLSGSG